MTWTESRTRMRRWLTLFLGNSNLQLMQKCANFTAAAAITRISGKNKYDYSFNDNNDNIDSNNSRKLQHFVHWTFGVQFTIFVNIIIIIIYSSLCVSQICMCQNLLLTSNSTIHSFVYFGSLFLVNFAQRQSVNSTTNRQWQEQQQQQQLLHNERVNCDVAAGHAHA